MSKRILILMCSIFLVVPLLFMGCSGDDGSTGATGATSATGPPGPPGQDLTAKARPESCQICHVSAGDQHQAGYDQLYQDNVIKATIDNAIVNPDNSVTVNFHVTKNGAAFSCKDLDNLNIYFTQYDNTTNRFQFASGQERLSIKGTSSNIVAGAGGLCTSTAALGDNAALLSNPGFVVVYGYDEQVGSIAARVRQVKYPYAALLPNAAYTALPNKYLSAANVAGCQKCHTVPYLKHGNIYGRTKGDFATEFVTCKACHLDNGEGGHQFWQELVDNPEMAAREWNSQLTTADNTYRAANYGYETRLMNDVHMSHAMEFEYPQSMASCVTCHEGKLLTKVLTDNNFTLETCKSCHPVNGSEQSEKPQPALRDIIPHTWTSSTVCANCHNGGTSAIAPPFNEIHNGYDKFIYDASGNKYSESFTVAIADNATLVGNALTFWFSVSGSGVPGIVPDNVLFESNTAMASPYGWDTKDFIRGNLSATPSKTGTAQYRATFTLPADWTDNMALGIIKRAEIAVRPRLKNAAGDYVALNAVSKTIDLTTKRQVNFYPAIADPALCNNCHDQLSTTFHNNQKDRGGSIVVCRMCHVSGTRGSHLELSSRSITNYAHAIRSFQAFDTDTYSFDNAVESMYYDLKIESTFPTFGLTNCVACHKAGRFNVPDSSKSLPAALSGTDNVTLAFAGWNRDILPLSSITITGAASMACGGCHKAEFIKEDNASELAAWNTKMVANGFMLDTGAYNSNYSPIWWNAVLTVMANFEENVPLISP